MVSPGSTKHASFHLVGKSLRPIRSLPGCSHAVSIVRDVITGSESEVAGKVVSVGVDDGEVPVLDLQGKSHGLAMLYDVEECI